MPPIEPRATAVTEALRSLSVRVTDPGGSGGDDALWEQLDGQLALLAADLAVAIDDRPNTCHECGARAARTPLATLAALLRPSIPPAPLTTEAAKLHRLAPVVWVIGNLLGQCDQHGHPAAILGPTPPADV
jgi:hypothetical protein